MLGSCPYARADPDGFVREMRSSWQVERRDAAVDLRVRGESAGRCAGAARLLDQGLFVRLRLVHRRFERLGRARRAARQGRLRRPHGRRASRQSDRARLSHAAGRRRTGVRHRIRSCGHAQDFADVAVPARARGLDRRLRRAVRQTRLAPQPRIRRSGRRRARGRALCTSTPHNA